jgi:TetR/AcrR family transcriptional repressor of nem operon
MKTHRPKRRRGRPAGSSGQETRRRILAATAARVRKDGLAATGVENAMRDAGLTHGAFYAHFASRGALLAEALGLAASEARDTWFAGLEALPREARFGQIVGRYLSAHHRDQPATGCAFGALVTEVARADRATRDVFETELRQTLSRLGESVGEDQQALAVMALAVGALALSRAVVDPDLSDALLLAARRAARQIAKDPP